MSAKSEKPKKIHQPHGQEQESILNDNDARSPNLAEIQDKRDGTQAVDLDQNILQTELTRIREELRETKSKYTILYNFAPAGYLTVNSQGVILETNLTLAGLLGYEKGSLVGQELTRLLAPDSSQLFQTHLQNTLVSGVHQNCELQMQKSDRSIFPVRLESIAIRDASGRLSQCIMTITDISESYQSQRIKNRHETVSTLSQDAIIVTDRELNIIEWNQAAENLFGWTANEVIGQSVSPQIQGKILACLNQSEVMESFSETGYWKGEATGYRKDGTEVKVLARIGVIWNGEGNFNGVAAMYRQVSEVTDDSATGLSKNQIESKVQERTEELVKANRILQQELAIHKRTALAAKESEGRNRDLVDNIKLGVFRCTPGPRGRFLEVNQAMEEISGYSRDELLHRDICDIFTTPKDGKPFDNEVNVADWKVTRELSLKRKDGKSITLSQTLVAIRFDSGAVQFFDGILEDVTDRKLAQQQVQQSLERLQRTIKEIIQAMAYIGEVRDPYTAGHQRRVAQLSYEIAKLMGLKDEQFEGLMMAAFVHDIGKILVPADILSKPGKLTKPEFDMLRDHSNIGYEILKTIEFPWPIAKIVLQHHERMDGSGYPSGLRGEQIILEARILAVADVVEAMSSHRPYRPALGIDKAIEEINLNKGTLYDGNVVEACVKLFNSKNFNLN